MVLIIGGAYQGKRDYARDALGASDAEIVAGVASRIRQMLAEGLNPEEEMARLAEGPWRNAVVLLREVGSGVVPLTAEERAWREAVGRAGVVLAARADRVIRVFLGIGTVIKGA